MRHFKTRAQAKKYLKENNHKYGLKIFKKLKGHRNRVKKPYVVGTELEWLNLY